MKKAAVILIKGIVVFLIYYILMVIFSLILPGTIEENGTKHLSTFNSILNIVLPALIIYGFIKLLSFIKKRNNAPVSETDVNTHSESTDRQLNSKQSREIADNLIQNARGDIDSAYNESSISLYFYWSERIRKSLEEAIKLEDEAGYKYFEKPSYLLREFEEKFQWKLRDAIEREENELISEINGPQHNNKRACCQRFWNEIAEYRNDFSEETIEYALNAYYHVCSIAGLSVQPINSSKRSDTMFEVDQMSGLEFEYYCADLLSKNGFTNVAVTKSSGDQGIDILAEKDDIKYAIQCKCYSTDLGNKPVQEAFAGKSIYNCQIAAVLTNRFFTQGAIEAAKATGVLLWDRRKLQRFIEIANS